MPREGHDSFLIVLSGIIGRFQSTCPARGTTFDWSTDNPDCSISIHVPREGHDRLIFLPTAAVLRFQSTCPARGTTVGFNGVAGSGNPFQSTCPARGTTPNLITIRLITRNFNPRAPRGARHQCQQYEGKEHRIFQSTCPARGTTYHSEELQDNQQGFQSTCPARGTTTG